MKHYYPLECRVTARATSPKGFHATDRVCAQDIHILIRSYLRLINQLAANQLCCSAEASSDATGVHVADSAGVPVTCFHNDYATLYTSVSGLDPSQRDSSAVAARNTNPQPAAEARDIVAISQ